MTRSAPRRWPRSTRWSRRRASASTPCSVERKKNTAELEFYQGDVNKAPPALRRQIEHVRQSLESQERFIQAQQGERQRINARFDEELVRLRELWRAQEQTSGAAAVVWWRAAVPVGRRVSATTAVPRRMVDPMPVFVGKPVRP